MHRLARTPQQRDRRFARVRRLTQSILVASGLATGAFVGYAASTAKPLIALTHPPRSSPTPSGTTATPTSSSAATPTGTGTAPSGAPAYAPPTTAPVTTTTTCYTTPSGSTVCY